jgi:chromosomal replication initiation ATPase DnaA
MLLVLKKTKNKQYYSKVINNINPEELRLKRKLAMIKAHELKVNLNKFSEFELGVMHIVCNINAMTVNDFTINSRKRELTEARFHFAAVLLIHFNYTYKKVGTLLGRDHSTIIHSMKQHLNFSNSIKSYKTRYNQIINMMEETYPGLMSTTLNPNIIVRSTPLKRSKLINKDAKTN